MPEEQLTNTGVQPTIDQQLMMESMKSQGFQFEQPAQVQPAAVETPITPTVETPAATQQEPAQVAPIVETQQPDYESFIEKEFGTRDVQTLKDRFTGYDALQQELTQLKGQPKYRTSTAETIDGLLDGVSATEVPKVLAKIAEFMSMDESQLSDRELVAFDLKLKFPEMPNEKLEAYINSKYGLGELATDEERLAGEGKMYIDSLDAKKNIVELKTKTLSTNPAKVQADLASIDAQKKVAQYNQLTDNSLKNFKTISLKTDKVDIADFAVDAKAVEKIRADVANAMVAGGFEATEENVHHIASALYTVNNLPHIINHVATQIQSAQVKKEAEDYHNANPKGEAVIQKVPLTEQDIKNQIARQAGLI